MQTGIGRRVPRHVADSLSALLHFRVEPSSNGTIDCLTDSLLTTNGMSLHHTQGPTTFSNANKNGKADGQGPQEPIPEELGLGVQKVRQSLHPG